MPTRRVSMVVREIIEHEFVADVEIDDVSLGSCESGEGGLISYLDEDWSLWNDALVWENCTIIENDIERAQIVGDDVPLTFGEAESGSVREINNHTNDSGDWCPWSHTAVTPKYAEEGCPANCANSAVEDAE